MKHAASYVEPRASRGSAGAASGCVVVAGRAGPGRDGLVVSRGLVAAEDRQPPRVLLGDRADGPGELPRDRTQRAASAAARTAKGSGTARASDRRPRPLAGARSDLDG